MKNILILMVISLMLIYGCVGVPTEGEAQRLDRSPDNDGDGLSNRQEVDFGSDPNNPDSDMDGSSDLMEYECETDPWNPDSDGDGVGDGEEDCEEDEIVFGEEGKARIVDLSNCPGPSAGDVTSKVDDSITATFQERTSSLGPIWWTNYYIHVESDTLNQDKRSEIDDEEDYGYSLAIQEIKNFVQEKCSSYEPTDHDTTASDLCKTYCKETIPACPFEHTLEDPTCTIQPNEDDGTAEGDVLPKVDGTSQDQPKYTANVEIEVVNDFNCKCE